MLDVLVRLNVEYINGLVTALSSIEVENDAKNIWDLERPWMSQTWDVVKFEEIFPFPTIV